MTEDQLREFIEERLREYDPLIDLTPGSDAQSEIVEPLMQRVGLEFQNTDFRLFAQDRLFQDLRISTTENDGIDDTLIKPTTLLLEPVKRAIASVRGSQSIRYPDSLSEEEADAILANWFSARRPGDYATGIGRMLFTIPTALSVTPSTRFLSTTGLVFYPTETQSITTEQMLLQKSGGYYYFDVVLQAESPGEEYTLEPGELVAVEGIGTTVQVTNLRRFSAGLDRETNEEFTQRAEDSLTERSLTSSRGNRARLGETFDDIVSMELVGYGDPEMQRDILTGKGNGDVFASGKCLMVRQYMLAFDGYEDRGEDGQTRPEVGDEVILNYSVPWHVGQPGQPPSAVDWTKKHERFYITKILFSSLDSGFTGWRGIFLYELDHVPVVLDPPAMSFTPWLSNIFLATFAHFKEGTITISGMPGGIRNPNTVDGRLRVLANQIHVGGHHDVYLRSATSAADSLVLDNLTDNLPLVSGDHLRTFGGTDLANVVEGWVNGEEVNWIRIGVLPGMTLVIENGLDAGSYKVLGVRPDSLIIDTELTAVASGLRYRVLDEVNVDLINPRNIKFPKEGTPPNDLSTTAGSDQLVLGTDLFEHGVEVGDIIEIESGADAGSFTIQRFDETLGGRGPVVERDLTATSSNLGYTVYSSQDGIQLPLIRVKSIEVLDSSQQPSGTTVPYALPVMCKNTCCYTGSEHLCDGMNGFVMPDLQAIEPNPDYSEYEGCYEQHLLVSEMVSGVEIDQTWYELGSICPEVDPPPDCIPSALWDTARRHWAKLFGDEGAWEALGLPENPDDWVLDAPSFMWDIAVSGGAVPERVPFIEVLFQMAGGAILFYSNDMVLENPDLLGEDALLWSWLNKEQDFLYGEPYEALGPFRVRRWYSEGCRECDGHIICICLDYNTQFEICLPSALFDGCNNVFVGLPDINIGELLDHLEEVVYQHRLTSQHQETFDEYDYDYGEIEGSYDPGSYDETPIQLQEVIRDLIKPPCLCESEPGDILTLNSGPNSGNYVISEIHTISLDGSLVLEEGDDERLQQILNNDNVFYDAIRGISYHTFPIDICLAKIEGQFPSPVGDWLNNLYSEPVTMQDLVGDYYSYLLAFLSNILGLAYDPENPGNSALGQWWDAYREVDLREVTINILREFGVDMGSVNDLRIPLKWGCDHEGLLEKLFPTQHFDTWEEWFDEIEKSYHIDKETIALLVVMLRRMNAFGVAGLWDFVSENAGEFEFDLEAWSNRWEGLGFDADALIYGGGLQFSPLVDLFNMIVQVVLSGFIEPGSSLAIVFYILLAIFGNFLYAMLYIPFATIWSIAVEGNPDLMPEKMVINLESVWQFIRELLFTPYSVGKPICDNHIRAYFMEPTTVEFDAGLGACDSAVPLVPSMFATRIGETEMLFSASSDVAPYDIMPYNEGSVVADLDLPRDIAVLDPAVPSHRDKMVFTDPSLGAPISNGIEPGRDELELFEQRFILPAPEPSKVSGIVIANKEMVPGLITTEGSPYVEIPDTAVYGWSSNHVGDMIFIERGDDEGGYRIIRMVNGKKVELDRPLTYSTMGILKEGYRATFNFQVDGTFEDPDAEFEDSDEGRYITIYGCPLTTHNGSYRIKQRLSLTSVELDVSGATYFTGEVQAIGQWVMTNAPDDTPEIYSDNSGREQVGVVPFRQYFGEPTIFQVVGISTSLSSDGYIRVDAPGLMKGMQRYPQDGYMQPFRIVRPGVQRFTSTQMADNIEDGLYFVDVKVRSLGAGDQYNLPEGTRFWAVFGSYKSDGYRYVVEDTVYSYSPEERVGLIFSPRILPVGSPDKPESMIQLVGQNIQVNYEHSPTVLNVHQFINSREDRPLDANPMARHYLPAWVYVFMYYQGGGEPPDLADEIIEYIKTLGPLDALQVDNVEKFVKNSGATYIQHPIVLRAAILDMRRNWIVIESDNFLRSTAEDPEFLGTDRLTYFNPGDNTSRLTEIPPGPQVRLERVLVGPLLR